MILDSTAICSVLRSTMSRYSSTYVSSIVMFLNFGIISCFRIINEKEGLVGFAELGGGAGGISTGPSLEMFRNFIVGGIEIEFWFKMESTSLGELVLDLRKAVILFMFLNCFAILL